MKILLNGVDELMDAVGPTYQHDGSMPIITVWSANFGGGKVTIEMTPDGGVTWIPLTRKDTNAVAEFTTDTCIPLNEVPTGYGIRAVLENAVGFSPVYCTLGA